MVFYHEPPTLGQVRGLLSRTPTLGRFRTYVEIQILFSCEEEEVFKKPLHASARLSVLLSNTQPSLLFAPVSLITCAWPFTFFAVNLSLASSDALAWRHAPFYDVAVSVESYQQVSRFPVPFMTPGTVIRYYLLIYSTRVDQVISATQIFVSPCLLPINYLAFTTN